MNRLYKSICYCSGPMDRVAWGEATEWRDMIKPILFDMNIGVIDPCDKPGVLTEDLNFRTKKEKLAADGDFDGLHECMKPVVNEDMRFVDLAHFLIFFLDTEAHICGSYMESCHAAAYQKKPVLTVIKGGREKTPHWWAGVNPPQFNFDDWESLIAYLKHVDAADEVDDHNRWRFIDMKKLYNEA